MTPIRTFAARLLVALLLFAISLGSAFALPLEVSIDAPNPSFGFSSAVAWTLAGLFVVCAALAAFHWSYVRQAFDAIQWCLKRYALVWLVLGFFGICSVFAAVARYNQIVLRQDYSIAASNGFFRAYVNNSNYWSLHTNGVPIMFGGNGALTGTTASLVATQAGGIALTARFVNGLLISTNGQQLSF